MTTLYTSNDGAGFDAQSTGSIATNWTAITGTWKVGTTTPQNGHVNSFGNVPATDGQVALLTGITAAADMDVVLAVKNNSSGNALPGLAVRCDSGFANGYIMTIVASSTTAGALQIYKRVSSAFTQLGGNGSYTVTASQTLNVRMQAIGSTIRLRVWSQDATEPTTWNLSVTDSSVSAAGYAGIYNCGSGSEAAFTDFVVSSLPANAMTVDSPGAVTASASITLKGSYTGTASSAVDYQYDGTGGFVALTSFTASGNSWSGTATAPNSNGLHYVTVQDHSTTTDTASSPAFTASGGATETISVTTPATQTVGTSYTYSGTYTNGPPSGLDYQFDAGSFTTASSPVISGGNWSFTATAPSAGSHTITVRDDGNHSISGTSGSFTTAAETISVTTPGTQTAGASSSYSGTFTGGAPTSLDYQFDSAGWNTVSGPTIGAGTFSFTEIAPAIGSHTISVRDHNATSISGTSGSFSTTSGLTIAITTPSGLIIDGQSLTVAGTYTGTAPSGLNVKVDSGSYVAASSPTIGGGNWSFAMTAPAFGSHTLTVQESNATSTTATSSAFMCSTAPNNAAIVYSPYNWNVAAGACTTINAGAYFRTLFSGASCVLNFNVTNMASPTSQIWWRVDDGPLTEAVVAATVTVTIPTVMASNADVPYHLLEVIVKSTTETANRWNSVGSATGTAVIFQGLTLAAAAVIVAPGKAGRNILIYGDSITEGVRTCGEAASNDTDRNDSWQGWAYRLGALLGAEVGVVGFGASGLSVTGSGSVPVLGTSYALLYSGASRSFSPAPDMIVFNEGTNDGSNNIVAAMTGVLNALITACPNVPLAVMRPFDGAEAANLQAAIAACNSPGICHYIDTTGFFNTAYGADASTLHPSGPNNLALIAPQVAAALKPLLGGSSVVTYRGGFQHVS